jgi:recombination protein RecT
MTAEQAVAVREESAIAPFRAALEDRISRIEELLPPTMDPRRFASVSLIALSKNPTLLTCDRASFVMAVLEAAEIGLEPTGGVGGAHLVPFKGRIQLILDYRGVQYLIREGGGGEVKTVLVYEGDYFKVYEGTENARIRHTKRFATVNPAQIQYVYAVPLDHPEKFEVMTKAEIDGIRARSKAANTGPWVSDYGSMARKSVLKRISAWLPLKPSARLDARALLDRDTMREIGADDEEPVRRSRTAEVRERVAARARAVPVSDAPGDPAEPEVAPTPTPAPDVSAGQQTEPVEAVAREVCGAESDPALGEVETCVLWPGHVNEPAAKAHQAATGSIWR